MNVATGLVRVSAFLFAAIGLGYLVAPAAMLWIVGIGSTPTTDFLMRTEGVALVSAAIFLWAARDGGNDQLRLVLIGLAAYFIVGSIVDLAAFSQDIVGSASVPSGVIRIAVGGLCAATAWRLSEARV